MVTSSGVCFRYPDISLTLLLIRNACLSGSKHVTHLPLGELGFSIRQIFPFVVPTNVNIILRVLGNVLVKSWVGCNVLFVLCALCMCNVMSHRLTAYLTASS